MIVKIFRQALGRIIVFFDFLTRPRRMKRSAKVQESVDQQTQNLALYQFYACPFCVKVRRAMHRLNLNIPLRDARNDEKSRQELFDGGGQIKVPCLQIKDNGGVKWMYESNDIIDYLEKRFGTQQ
jgi:glutaredoxin